MGVIRGRKRFAAWCSFCHGNLYIFVVVFFLLQIFWCRPFISFSYSIQTQQQLKRKQRMKKKHKQILCWLVHDPLQKPKQPVNDKPFYSAKIPRWPSDMHYLFSIITLLVWFYELITLVFLFPSLFSHSMQEDAACMFFVAFRFFFFLLSNKRFLVLFFMIILFVSLQNDWKCMRARAHLVYVHIFVHC